MYNLLTVWVLRFVAVFFVVFVVISIYFYPGGNIHDPAQPGYSLTHNFLSDLGGYSSHSGAVNFLSSFCMCEFCSSAYVFLQSINVYVYWGWSVLFVCASIV